MLYLVNIKISGDIIEADYIPEDSKNHGHVRLKISTRERLDSDMEEKYGGMYLSHAFSGLKQILDELDKCPDWQIPEKWTVAWF